MFIDLYNYLIKKEPIKDINIFFEDYQSFEEVPLVSRYSHLEFIKKFIQKDDIQLFLINFSCFYLDCIKLHAKKRLSTKELNDFFVCLTFNDLDDLKTEGYCIPNFFITKKINLLSFLKSKDEKKSLDNYSIINTAFIESGLLYKFSFKKTVSGDQLNGGFERVYAILKSDLKRLKI